MDPVCTFENRCLVRVLVRATVEWNRVLFCAVHSKEEQEGLNWEEYFDDTANLYVNLRWFADYRHLFWLWLFFMVCWFIYRIGMHM